MYRHTAPPPPPMGSDMRPSYLIEGWHELAIDRCKCLFREHVTSANGLLFVVEGQVRRSTAPFSGCRWAYVCALKNQAAQAIMDRIVLVSNSLEVARVANQAELSFRYELRMPDLDVAVNPSVIVLAAVSEKSIARHTGSRLVPSRVLVSTFMESL